MPLLDAPIITIGCNRSGTTLLFNNLAAHPVAWSLPIESQEIFHFLFVGTSGRRCRQLADGGLEELVGDGRGLALCEMALPGPAGLAGNAEPAAP